ncbi:MAG: 2,3-bisphosphoglycerate-independent phosphoglycerate mutase [Candidatus Magasanikbacteria bacterium]|nr:2,3-bisphosphoglycerate-independent phosphoglycerate mutase [Candidatus Magasanikbacteria bacterium]
MIKKQTTVLIILDGWGVEDPKKPGNPITPKTAPHYFGWLKKYPHTELAASGVAVGLFRGQEGNSEAGHLNIGAGRVVKQDALYISDAIKDGTFFKNPAFHQAMHHVKKYRTAVHLMGLLSNHNSAHSCPEHLEAILGLLHGEGISKVYLHLFTDGRDSGQHDALQHLKRLKSHFHGTEKVATVMGRLYGMDRNKNWVRTERAYRAIVLGAGRKVNDPEEALAQAYNSGESDEFISPSVITNTKGEPLATLRDNDAIIFFNLRSDRARQLTKVFVQPDFERLNPDSFARKKIPANTRFVALTDFGPDLPGVLTAFPSRDVPNSLVMTLCPRRQLYLAESEKFAHITYFFNGGYAQHFCDEQWVKIQSDRVDDFEFDPEMKAKEVAAYAVKAIERETFEFIAINFANADMVGHTGNLAAAEKAIAALDASLAKIVAATLKTGGQCVITADHGNVEEMINAKTGEVDSEHSLNPVPFIIIAPPAAYKKWGARKPPLQLRPGNLADVAPTILKMMGIQKPAEMTGRALF